MATNAGSNGSTYVDARRMFILADVAAHTDDRMLLLETMSEAHDAYSNGSPAVRREAAGLLGLAAWQRDDVHEALRWLGADISLFVTPLLPTVLDQLTLTARVASTAGDAGLLRAGAAEHRGAGTRAPRSAVVRGGRTACPRNPGT